MKVNDYNFDRWLGKPVVSRMTPGMRRLWRRIPDYDLVYATFGFDSDLNALYYKDGSPELVTGELVRLENRLYFTFRIKSILLLGNPDGKPRDIERIKQVVAPPAIPAKTVSDRLHNKSNAVSYRKALKGKLLSHRRVYPNLEPCVCGSKWVTVSPTTYLSGPRFARIYCSMCFTHRGYMTEAHVAQTYHLNIGELTNG